MTSTELGSKVILGSLTIWLCFEKLSLYPHSFMYFQGSWTNITMIVKVCVMAKAGETHGLRTALFICIFKRNHKH